MVLTGVSLAQGGGGWVSRRFGVPIERLGGEIQLSVWPWTSEFTSLNFISSSVKWDPSSSHPTGLFVTIEGAAVARGWACSPGSYPPLTSVQDQREGAALSAGREGSGRWDGRRPRLPKPSVAPRRPLQHRGRLFPLHGLGLLEGLLRYHLRGLHVPPPGGLQQRAG